MHPDIVCAAQAILGEGPAWDVKTGTLSWVDILGKRVHYHHADDDGFIQLEEMPGCLTPCKDGNLIVTARASILKLGPATAKTSVLTTLSEPANNRFNDGKCDPAGRFLAGTMDMDEKLATGALYSFDGSQVRCCDPSSRGAWLAGWHDLRHRREPVGRYVGGRKSPAGIRRMENFLSKSVSPRRTSPPACSGGKPE